MFGSKVEVIPFRKFMDTPKDNIDFFLINLQREVKNDPQKAIKLKRSLSQTLTVFTSFLAMSHPALAKTTNTLPPEIDLLLVKIQLICLGISAGLAVICLMLAGMFKMFGLSSKAQTWTWDIIKGLCQVLIAPVAVGIIVATGRVLLKPFSGYVPF